jgi:hypothetical protein
LRVGTSPRSLSNMERGAIRRPIRPGQAYWYCYWDEAGTARLARSRTSPLSPQSPQRLETRVRVARAGCNCSPATPLSGAERGWAKFLGGQTSSHLDCSRILASPLPRQKSAPVRDAEPAWSRGSPSPAADYGFWPLCILLEAGEAVLGLLCEIGDLVTYASWRGPCPVAGDTGRDMV